MRILFLSFYFPPDLSAGSFRARALIDSLVSQLPEKATIHVITTLPNRYASHDEFALAHEQLGALTVDRISLPSHQSGTFDQARAFVRFYRESLRLVRGESYDLVFATSSRLMTAFLGARISRKMKTPLYLDIRDIFVDTMKDVFPGIKAKILLPVLSRVEAFTFRSAKRVNLVSEGFRSYFESRYPNLPYDFFTNGIDEEFLDRTVSPTGPSENAVIQVLYAGNIGEGQGLHKILPQLAKKCGERYRFTVVGDGGRKNLLQEALADAGVHSVEILPPVPRKNLHQMYQRADVLFLHLNDYDAFAKVLPSKLFEYAATGKPMLAGVGGYAAHFLRTEVANCGVFSPCDVEEGFDALNGLSFELNARVAFVEKYSRKKIMDRMAQKLLATIPAAP